MNPEEPLRNRFEMRSLTIRTNLTLGEGGPHVCQGICCWIVCAKDVEKFIGLSHERNDFVVQAMTFNGANGVSINHLEYDMSRVSGNRNLGEVYVG